MMLFLDESGDLGWSFDKPYQKGGSSRFITIGGFSIERRQLKFMNRFINELYQRHNFMYDLEKKGSRFSNEEAASIVREIGDVNRESDTFRIVSITVAKQNVAEALRRDKNVFYNYMLNRLVTDVIAKFSTVDIVLDSRTIRTGSQNSFEDCLRVKCWGELGLTTSISCRYKESDNDRGIWLADWLSNFIWRHYENNMHDAYDECLSHGQRYHEKKLFM